MTKTTSAGATTAVPAATVTIDLSGPAAAAALNIAQEMYEKLIPLRPPADTSPEALAAALTTQARQVGMLAWEVLYAMHLPRRP